MTVAAVEGGGRTTTDDMTTGAAGSLPPHWLLAHADHSRDTHTLATLVTVPEY